MNGRHLGQIGEDNNLCHYFIVMKKIKNKDTHTQLSILVLKIIFFNYSSVTVWCRQKNRQSPDSQII